jgi:hypothetical protein
VLAWPSVKGLDGGEAVHPDAGMIVVLNHGDELFDRAEHSAAPLQQQLRTHYSRRWGCSEAYTTAMAATSGW